jgi:uncharacterized membrane protein YhaH (DUF805 family)
MRAPLDQPLYGASWGVAIARFFGNYAIFRGRASPSEYWWWALTNALVTLALNLLANALGADPWQDGPLALPLAGGASGAVTSVPGLLALIYTLGTLLPNLALTWRRLHDTDRSGGWFFLFVVPLIGWIVLFFFLIGRPREEGRRFD